MTFYILYSRTIFYKLMFKKKPFLVAEISANHAGKLSIAKKLIFACPETPNTEAKKLMIENQIRHLPVFSDEHLVGIISMRDVFNV